jgi:hypothetical protein
MGLEPPYLGDRADQLESFRSYLAEPGAPRNVLVTGLRGVGKTVLLNHYSREAEEAGWLVVEREFSDYDAAPPVFATTVLADLTDLTRRLSRAARAKAATRAIADALLEHLGTLTVSYSGIEVGLKPTSRPAVARHRLDDDLRGAMEQLGRLCGKTDHAGVLLRYDEFHVIREKSNELTLSALLAAVAAVQQKSLPVMLVLCGLPPVQENLARSKSYSERMFVPEHLGNLQPPEDRAALVDPAVRRGRRYDEAVVDAVQVDTDGYPFFIQLFGDALWKGSNGQVITHRDFQRLRPAILATLDRSFFESRFLRASGRERQILTQIADYGETCSVAELRHRTRLSNSQLQPHIGALLHKGLVYRPSRGQIGFTAPMFGAYLRRRTD